MNMLSGARLNNVRKARQACSRQQSWQGLAMGFAQIQYRASHPAQAWAGMASPSLTFKEIVMFNQVLWFIESNDYDDVLVSINIDTPFEDETVQQQLELFEDELA